jgi:multidrug efflux pump subunit AcrB
VRVDYATVHELRYREGDKLVPIISRAPSAERLTAEQLGNVLVYSPGAQRYVPVAQLVTGVEVEWVDAVIRRVNRFPMIKAQADPLPSELAGPLQERLRAEVEAIALPPGYAFEWHGEDKTSRDANVGLLMFRVPFEFMAILGFPSLIGMLVKNSIVLVDQADVEIRGGQEPYGAVINAAVSRARPVFLGALTTILGVAPLLLDTFFKSMAVTIMFGLAFATLLTLASIGIDWGQALPNPQLPALHPRAF